MDAKSVRDLVNSEIRNFAYEPPEPGTTVGVPWPEEKILGYLPRLRECLCFPHLETFHLRDTYDQVRGTDPEVVTYWVVAKENSYLVFYDPIKSDFGLAALNSDGQIPSTIGVRGDLVGVFIAI